MAGRSGGRRTRSRMPGGAETQQYWTASDSARAFRKPDGERHRVGGETRPRTLRPQYRYKRPPTPRRITRDVAVRRGTPPRRRGRPPPGGQETPRLVVEEDRRRVPCGAACGASAPKSRQREQDSDGRDARCSRLAWSRPKRSVPANGARALTSSRRSERRMLRRGDASVLDGLRFRAGDRFSVPGGVCTRPPTGGRETGGRETPRAADNYAEGCSTSAQGSAARRVRHECGYVVSCLLLMQYQSATLHGREWLPGGSIWRWFNVSVFQILVSS